MPSVFGTVVAVVSYRSNYRRQGFSGIVLNIMYGQNCFKRIDVNISKLIKYRNCIIDKLFTVK